MKFRHIFLGNTEYRLLAVGAYSFAAFSVAALVQILSSGTAKPEFDSHLARVALTAMPLLATGLALDFYCVNRPKMTWLAALLSTIIGALIAISSNSMSVVLGFYSPKVAEYMNYGVWGGFAVLVLASIASWFFDSRDAAPETAAHDSNG